MRRHLAAFVTAIVGAAVAVAPVLMPAQASAAVAGALWHLDETSGITAVDSSGNHNDGAISNVVLGKPGRVGTAFGFNGVSSRITVQSSPSLNPGAGNFSYTVSARLTVMPPRAGATYDMMRKGLSTTTGGEYKLEIVNGNGLAKARCTAKDSAGHIAKRTHSKNLADGAWHVITCSRTGSSWTVTVDGIASTTTAPLGSIDNTKVLTIGAKDGGKTGGDWYNGDLDEVDVSVG